MNIMNNNKQKNWRDESRKAKHWHLDGAKVNCDLCPRHCSMKENQKGFCLVRGRVGDELHTFNYGVSVQATIENIETEAVNHYRPGARILSMGNIGCMMACSYCQNWQTSQVKHLNDKNVHYYSPEEVIQLAIENEIEIISWTYNDPVVWQEFVVDTSRLAQQHGIKTLYKSALYIEEAPLKELIEVVDIFSVSLKGMKEEMYRKYTKGSLGPVLDSIKQIAQSDRHLEISQLIVTEMNDNGEDAIRTADWILENVGEDTPLHLVAYHPAFRYTKKRTSIEALLKLRKIVLDRGLNYCYLGNVYAEEVSNTICKKCSSTLVKRFGLTVDVVGVNEHNSCKNCGSPVIITEALKGQSSPLDIDNFIKRQDHKHNWDGEINSLHIVLGDSHAETILKIEHLPEGRTEFVQVSRNLERLIISKRSVNESAVRISANVDGPLIYLPVLDRAHFPVEELSKSSHKYLN
jgi:pyruvate formate lyase activating enzyme